jgi:hypothetical protein
VNKVKQVDYDDRTRNMFGLLPCPQCFNTRRYPTRPDHRFTPNVIMCNVCDHTEPIEPEEQS